jgi:hypothetical protein
MQSVTFGKLKRLVKYHEVDRLEVNFRDTAVGNCDE